jgi:hypothetical protein
MLANIKPKNSTRESNSEARSHSDVRSWRNFCSFGTLYTSLTAISSKVSKQATMAVASTTILSFLLFLPMILSSSSAKVVDEEFSEELLLKPLPDRKVLAHFHFQTEAPIADHSFARHHHLFPKSISQLVCLLHFPLSHFRVRLIIVFNIKIVNLIRCFLYKLLIW